jgi:hypothetical protein
VPGKQLPYPAGSGAGGILKTTVTNVCLLLFSVLALWFFPIGPVLAVETNSPVAALRFLGAQSCSTSGCHGGAGELNKQFTIWIQYDFHHQRPVATLTTARSERLASVLKITDPTKDTRCTSCHAPFQTVPAVLLDKEVKITEGVSCESCHGPAEKWLLSHTRKDYSHADRVHAGMRDLKNPYVRANTCVACHQNVDSDLLRAGHPELIFELDGQAVTQPKHWRKELDKPGPQFWLVGQAVALREMSWQLATEKNPHADATNRWAGLFWLLQQIQMANTGEPLRTLQSFPIDSQNIVPTQRWADQLAQHVAVLDWSDSLTRKCLRRLARVGDAFGHKDVPQPIHARRAEYLVLALDRLAQALPGKRAGAVNELLDILFMDVQSLPDFDPTKFASDLKMFQTFVAAPVEAE